MEPNDLADIQEAALDAALAAGMDPDVATIAYSFDAKTGDAKVTSTSAAGKAFELVVTAAEIADALDADVSEDAMDAAAMPMADGAAA